jgi:hypothetical protein
MRMLVATSQMQGARAGDLFEAEEGEIVMPVLCDGAHAGCSCSRLMVGVRTGRETTTAEVVESDMSRDEFRRELRESEWVQGFTKLGVSARVLDRQADALLELAAQFSPGAIVERDGDDFEERPAGAGAQAV